MFRRPSALALLAALLAPALAHAAWSNDPSVNTTVALGAGTRYGVVSASDGAGGVFLGWADTRGGNADVYVQHLLANGAAAPGWTANGVALTNVTGSQQAVQILPDPSGGLYATWIDDRAGQDVFVQRVLANGTIAPGWPANGLRVWDGQAFQPKLCTDGAGGVFVSFGEIYSVSDYDEYLARVTPAGVVVTGFPVTVDFSGGIQQNAEVVADGSGGACVVYQSEAGVGTDIMFRHFSAGAGLIGTYALPYTGNQTRPHAVADGLGGVIVAYTDEGTSPSVVDVVCIPSAGGGLQWGARGVMGNGGDMYEARSICSDGARGAYVVAARSFLTVRMLATHVTAAGLRAPGWSTEGNALSPSAFPAMAPCVADGRGGLVTGWYDGIMAPFTVQRLLGNGAAPLGWPAPTLGIVPGLAPLQGDFALAPDGAGGVIAAWTDGRASSYGVYAQRIERFGRLGNPEPSIVSVRDVPVDQGGRVRVSWTPSYLDAEPAFGVASYRIWRQVPARLAAQALAAGAVLAADGGAGVEGANAAKTGARVLRTTTDATATVYWEQVATQLANGQAGYSFVASTEGDSVGAGNPRTLFMVEAVGTDGAFWDSAPDSGYSVDNLPPATPAPFTGAYAPSFTHLSWGRSSDADFVGFRLYRGATPGFVPSGATLFTSQPDTGYVAPGGNWYWKLTAVDVHGNESAPALVSPSGTVGVGDAPLTLAFERTGANPTRGASVFRLALPRAASASVRVYDAAGRQVREVASGEFGAGAHELRWDGRDAAGGEAGPGLYFVRVSTPGLERSVRVVRL